tara:strand:+ start:88 stop:288 length:201 start_codon:yes stop_codon:yes gene_type:complete
MDYSELRQDYALALWNACNTPNKSLQNQYSAKASQLGASISMNEKTAIQKNIKIQLLLRATFGDNK